MPLQQRLVHENQNVYKGAGRHFLAQGKINNSVIQDSIMEKNSDPK